MSSHTGDSSRLLENSLLMVTAKPIDLWNSTVTLRERERADSLAFITEGLVYRLLPITPLKLFG